MPEAERHRDLNTVLLVAILTFIVGDGLVWGFWGMMFRALVFAALLITAMFVLRFVLEAAGEEREEVNA